MDTHFYPPFYIYGMRGGKVYMYVSTRPKCVPKKEKKLGCLAVNSE